MLDGLLAASTEGLSLADEVVVDDWSDSSAWDWAPLAALGYDTGLRLVDEIEVDGKDVVAVENLGGPVAPSYLFGYARGELLYLLESRGPDAPRLDEMLVSLPEVGTGAAMAQDAETPGQARVIELEADAALRFTQHGEQLHDIPVVPGETVLLRIDNTAGFDHSFYIGTDSELDSPYAATEVGIPEWSSGVRELAWTVREDISALKFGCTVPGHYPLMQGCFSEARVGPDGTVGRVAEAETCPLADLDGVSGITDEWRPGGRIEVPWAGIAVTFPDTWEVNVESEPGGARQPHATVLFGATAQGDS